MILVIIISGAGCKSKSQSTEDPREKNRVIDSTALAYLETVSKNDTAAVFVFTKDFPETKRLKNSKIIIKPLNQDLRINYDAYVRKEYMGPLYILLPAYYTGIRASVILKCFPAYKGFTLKDLSENYVVYYSDQQR